MPIPLSLTDISINPFLFRILTHISLPFPENLIALDIRFKTTLSILLGQKQLFFLLYLYQK